MSEQNLQLAADLRIEAGRQLYELTAAISRSSQRRLQSKMAAIGLSAAAYNLICVIRENAEITLTQAAKVLRVETASLSTLAVRLERDGFLERVRSTKDKRTQFLRLTEAAQNVQVQADRIMDIEVVDMTHRMSDLELTTLNGYLQRVLKNIE